MLAGASSSPITRISNIAEKCAVQKTYGDGLGRSRARRPQLRHPLLHLKEKKVSRQSLTQNTQYLPSSSTPSST